jgi:hypothetical protein
MDLDPAPAQDPDPTPDPTPFLIDFKDAKKIFFFHIFSYNLPTGTYGNLQSKKFISQALFQSA